MKKFGLKLWSKDFICNKPFAQSAEKALKEGIFDYLELFALPESFDDTYEIVKRDFYGIKTVIHAPHSVQNLDISNVDAFEDNKHKLYDAQRFADLLKADIIILHPGFGRDKAGFDENLRQFRAFNDKRLTVENLPLTCSSTGKDLQGVTPLEIKCFIEATGCQFCLDFSHATCGANALKRNVYEVLSDFKALKPAMYHLCDGDVTSTIDAHLHFGHGNYDLRRLVLEYTSDDALITMETGSGIPSSVSPWLNDINYIQTLIK